VITYHMRG